MNVISSTTSATTSATTSDARGQPTQRELRLALSRAIGRHGISVVLPAYNEEAAIGTTLAAVVAQLDVWDADFEVIVVNDGSRDRTGAVVEEVARRDPRVRQIVHTANRGYGGALASGFAAATKDLTFFMDSDGQYAIADLARLLVWIDEVDAVLGYRIARQDTRMRCFNAWGWNVLVRLVLGVGVRDLDCAFKLLRTVFLRTYPPETRSALINAELLYKLTRSGAAYREVGVTHLPRQGGQATGANLRVIARAVRDLVLCAWRWRRASLDTLAKPMRAAPGAPSARKNRGRGMARERSPNASTSAPDGLLPPSPRAFGPSAPWASPSSAAAPYSRQ
ncbi:MAG TPA: glycosyltransferase family 2 protein [Ktedonobacterales bacterium]